MRNDNKVIILMITTLLIAIMIGCVLWWQSKQELRSLSQYINKDEVDFLVEVDWNKLVGIDDWNIIIEKYFEEQNIPKGLLRDDVVRLAMVYVDVNSQYEKVWLVLTDKNAATIETSLESGYFTTLPEKKLLW